MWMRGLNNMVKKITSILLSLILLTGLSLTSFASNYDENQEAIQTIEYFEDGSSLEIILRAEPVLTRSNSFNAYGTKTLTFRDNDGNVIWEVNFKATFNVNQGVSATCTAASFETPRIYDSNWKYITNTTSKNGNKASGTITMRKYFMGLPVRTETPTTTITCDIYGKLT